MASNTKFLDLLKKDPVADKDDTFNIETMLNENWDKLDAEALRLACQIEGRAQIVTGSYIGTGVSGEEDWNVLGFDFEPKYVEIFEVVQHHNREADAQMDCFFDSKLVFINPFTFANRFIQAENCESGNTTYQARLHVTVEWDGWDVYWRTSEFNPDINGKPRIYDTWAETQANIEGTEYFYVAIG